MSNKTSNHNYYIKHKKKLNEIHRQYYLDNKKRILEVKKKRYHESKEVIRKNRQV